MTKQDNNNNNNNNNNNKYTGSRDDDSSSKNEFWDSKDILRTDMAKRLNIHAYLIGKHLVLGLLGA